MIDKELSQKILTLGVSKTTYGGMAAVLVSYEKCFEKMRFIPTWRLGNRAVKAWYAFQAIVRCFLLLLLDKRIKILHIHGAANASMYRKGVFIKMGKRFGKKVILHQHAADFIEFFRESNDKPQIIKIINLCDKLIVLSQSYKEYFSNIGILKEKICVLNNIVFPPKEKWKKEKDGKLHLLYLGEVGYRKGIYDLLNVLNANKEYFEDKIVLRIGGNIAEGDINGFIAEHDLSSFVKYEGWVSGTKKTECLEWADVYILPSYNEGLPIAILEAMSYSHPVISTDVGGIPEILHSNENGVLIKPGNEEQIKEALVFFVENPEKISEYGKNAYQTVQPFFPENVFSELEKIYKELLV
ncbi:MAG: glycosyltransferase family 4 protein [Fibrobacter sp.]|jgi:glycosyltransferase involved in cell wall biosynthesis|nr:glycosyltransferase family 4 protein [Fibrobacter sp.]